LQAVEGDSVVLVKEDGTTVKVPVKRLHQDDQDWVHCYVIRNTPGDLAKAVDAFLGTDFGETDVQVEDREQAAARKLYARVNGRQIQLSFPIRNVTPDKSGRFKLTIGDPSIPGKFFGRKEVAVRLSKDESLKIGGASILIVEGKLRAAFQRQGHTLPIPDWVLFRGSIAKLPSGAQVAREVWLGLDGLTAQIQTDPQKPEEAFAVDVGLGRAPANAAPPLRRKGKGY
jgi:hypothetical protein